MSLFDPRNRAMVAQLLGPWGPLVLQGTALGGGLSLLALVPSSMSLDQMLTAAAVWAVLIFGCQAFRDFRSSLWTWQRPLEPAWVFGSLAVGVIVVLPAVSALALLFGYHLMTWALPLFHLGLPVHSISAGHSDPLFLTTFVYYGGVALWVGQYRRSRFALVCLVLLVVFSLEVGGAWLVSYFQAGGRWEGGQFRLPEAVSPWFDSSLGMVALVLAWRRFQNQEV